MDHKIIYKLVLDHHILILCSGTTSRSGPRTGPEVARGAQRQVAAVVKRPAASISFYPNFDCGACYPTGQAWEKARLFCSDSG